MRNHKPLVFILKHRVVGLRCTCVSLKCACVTPKGHRILALLYLIVSMKLKSTYEKSAKFPEKVFLKMACFVFLHVETLVFLVHG